MNTLAVILARAGSRGLAHKNALPLAGRPLLRWTIDHARASQSVGHVVVSTDGQALATIARDAGIAVIPRPAELASAVATVDGAARHAVTTTEEQLGRRFDAVVILYGNVPLRPADLTDRAVDLLQTTGCDSVQSIYPVGKAHPYWMRVLDDDARLTPYQPNDVYRRQDLPPVYMLDGGVIAVRRDSLLIVEEGRPHAFLGEDRRAVVTQPGEVVDIDSQLDLHLAEAILASRADGGAAGERAGT